MQATTTVQEDEKSAYRCQVQDYRLSTKHEPKRRSDCATVSDAVEQLQKGKSVVVANSDMGSLRSRLAGLGIG